MQFKKFLENKNENPWKAKKEEILNSWRNIKPSSPIIFDPVPAVHKGTRYDQDGIRITGSQKFIFSVLSRLKDLVQYEKYPELELDVKYQQVKSKYNVLDTKPSFVCYIYVAQKK